MHAKRILRTFHLHRRLMHLRPPHPEHLGLCRHRDKCQWQIYFVTFSRVCIVSRDLLLRSGPTLLYTKLRCMFVSFIHHRMRSGVHSRPSTRRDKESWPALLGPRFHSSIFAIKGPFRLQGSLSIQIDLAENFGWLAGCWLVESSPRGRPSWRPERHFTNVRRVSVLSSSFPSARLTPPTSVKVCAAAEISAD